MAHPTGEFGLPDGSNVPYILVHDDGLETVRSGHLESLQTTPAELYRHVAPEVLPGPEKEAYGSTTSDSYFNSTLVSKSSIIPKKRPRWTFWLSIIAVALLIIATATAVSLGLHHSRDSRSPPSKPVIAVSNASTTPILSLTGTSNASSLTPQTLSTSGASTVSSLTPHSLSTSGAFNGTSLATFHSTLVEELATQIFYQDYQGQLRRIEKDGSQWSGGPAIAAVVSSNAKNATPLGCANYTDATTNAQKVRLSALSRLQVCIDIPVQANLFYVDPNNVLQEVISTDNFQTWETSTLGNSAVKVSESSFALTAWYTAEYGLRLYYGGVDGLVHEMVYMSDEGVWSKQFQFQGSNGNGGIAHSIYTDNPGIAQLYMLDTQNAIRLWNFNFTPTATSYWVLDPSPANVTSAAVNSTLASALGWICFQEESGAISAIQQVSGTTSTAQTYQSASVWGQPMNVGGGSPQTAIQGSAIAAAVVTEGGYLSPSLDIWYQPKGNKIMESLDLDGTFDNTFLPV